MEGDTPERDIDFNFDVSDEAGAAVYANIVSIWFSPYEFGLDWGLTEAAEAEDPDDPTSPLRIPRRMRFWSSIAITLYFWSNIALLSMVIRCRIVVDGARRSSHYR